ncbi:hypothetical protein ATANTOWER_012351 [Ataeniobius toweri]|uniref:Uncharacterized protein n=1 Tax=Ataeniobius toweri TaxID=208326 RepID=A0ABU7C911_9TELE|nr:hypothetical protein [Ataeniobius toweri]
MAEQQLCFETFLIGGSVETAPAEVLERCYHSRWTNTIGKSSTDESGSSDPTAGVPNCQTQDLLAARQQCYQLRHRAVAPLQSSLPSGFHQRCGTNIHSPDSTLLTTPSTTHLPLADCHTSSKLPVLHVAVSPWTRLCL